MPGMPWLKLYVDDVLNDATFNSLDDCDKWTYIQLLALAGECDAGGAFLVGSKPMPIEVIAWRLGLATVTLAQRIDYLVKAGKLIQEGDSFIVVEFLDKQGPSQAEQREKWRKRQAKHRGNDSESEEELRLKSKEEELRLKSGELRSRSRESRVTSPVTDNAAAAALPENWTSIFMADYLKETGQEADTTLAEQAVNKTLDYIQGKNYAVKYNFTWISERYSLLCKTAQKAKRDYSIPEYDDYQDDSIPEHDIPEGVMHIFDAVSTTWPAAWRTNMTPIGVNDECITIGVSGHSIDVAQARYGKTLENTFMKPVEFTVM